jgi:hypothetical protein
MSEKKLILFLDSGDTIIDESTKSETTRAS